MMNDQFHKQIKWFWTGRMSRKKSEELLSELIAKDDNIKKELQKDFDQPNKESLLSVNKSDELLQSIHQKMGISSIPEKKNKIIYHWAAAAAILFILGSVALIGLMNHIKSIESTTNSASNQEIISPRFHHISAGNDTLHYTLSDGSQVTLSPHSELKYHDGYGKQHRQLVLDGEGRFAVKRDSTLPFSVLSLGYTTTALGTEFIVNSSVQGKISVRLLSGKIVVRSTSLSEMIIKDVFLAAGEELILDQHQQIVNIIPGKNLLKTHQKIAQTKDKNVLILDELHFDKTELKYVFNQIATKFNIHINTDSVQIDDLSFTGKFSEKDSINIILNTLCMMNDLTYESIDTQHFLIKKTRLKPLSIPDSTTSTNEISM